MQDYAADTQLKPELSSSISRHNSDVEINSFIKQSDALSDISYDFTDLLFQDKKTVLTSLDQRLKIVSLIKFLVKEMSEAFGAFKNGQYSKFDAQVGENLCQIRACFILEMVRLRIDDINNDIHSFMLPLHSMIEKLKLYEKHLLYIKYDGGISQRKEYKKPATIIDFINSNEFNIKLKKDMLILVYCYLLRRYCVLDDNMIPIAIDFKKMQTVSKLSKHYVKRTIHFYQKVLSEISTSYLHYLANYSSDLEIRNLLKATERVSDENRIVLSCYIGMKVILDYLRVRHWPILLIVSVVQKFHIRKITIYFDSCESRGVYIPSNAKKKNIIQSPVFIVEGISSYQQSIGALGIASYINRLLEAGIEDILLMNMASHPQYTGKRLVRYRNSLYTGIHEGSLMEFIHKQEIEYVKMKQKSESLGCCDTNSSLCLVKHIFCDNMVSI